MADVNRSPSGLDDHRDCGIDLRTDRVDKDRGADRNHGNWAGRTGSVDALRRLPDDGAVHHHHRRLDHHLVVARTGFLF